MVEYSDDRTGWRFALLGIKGINLAPVANGLQRIGVPCEPFDGYKELDFDDVFYATDGVHSDTFYIPSSKARTSFKYNLILDGLMQMQTQIVQVTQHPHATIHNLVQMLSVEDFTSEEKQILVDLNSECVPHIDQLETLTEKAVLYFCTMHILMTMICKNCHRWQIERITTEDLYKLSYISGYTNLRDHTYEREKLTHYKPKFKTQWLKDIYLDIVKDLGY